MKISKDEFNLNYQNDEWFYSALTEITGVLTTRMAVRDAEDIRQLAIIRCFNKRHLYKPETGKAFSYFFRIAHNEFRYQLREREMKKIRVIDLIDNLTDEDGPEDWIKIGERWWSAPELTAIRQEEGTKHKFIKRIRRESNV